MNAAGAGSPLMYRSFITKWGPLATTLRYASWGFSSVEGQDSSTFTLPVMITWAPCLTSAVENWTSCQATVFILRKPSCARSPCAEATPAVTSVTSSASTEPEHRVEALECRMVVLPPRISDRCADRRSLVPRLRVPHHDHEAQPAHHERRRDRQRQAVQGQQATVV